MRVAEYAKAVSAALTAGYAVFEWASSLNSAAGEVVTTNEWVRIAVFTLVGGLAVWLVPNAKPEAELARMNTLTINQTSADKEASP
jgi:hypothetical protein